MSSAKNKAVCTAGTTGAFAVYCSKAPPRFFSLQVGRASDINLDFQLGKLRLGQTSSPGMLGGLALKN